MTSWEKISLGIALETEEEIAKRRERERVFFGGVMAILLVAFIALAVGGCCVWLSRMITSGGCVL